LNYYLHGILWFCDILSEIFWFWIYFICDIFSPYRIDVVYYIYYIHVVKLNCQLVQSLLLTISHQLKASWSNDFKAMDRERSEKINILGLIAFTLVTELSVIVDFNFDLKKSKSMVLI